MKLVGIEQLETAIKEKQKYDKKVTLLVKQYSAKIKQDAQRLAPVDTGHLKGKIENTILEGGKKAVIESGAEYAIYQEYGTRYQKGTPHLGPAFYQHEKEFRKAVRDLIWKP